MAGIELHFEVGISAIIVMYPNESASPPTVAGLQNVHFPKNKLSLARLVSFDISVCGRNKASIILYLRTKK